MLLKLLKKVLKIFLLLLPICFFFLFLIFLSLIGFSQFSSDHLAPISRSQLFICSFYILFNAWFHPLLWTVRRATKAVLAQDSAVPDHLCSREDPGIRNRENMAEALKAEVDAFVAKIGDKKDHDAATPLTLEATMDAFRTGEHNILPIWTGGTCRGSDQIAPKWAKTKVRGLVGAISRLICCLILAISCY